MPSVGDIAPMKSSIPGGGTSTVKDGWLTPASPSDPPVTGVPAGGRLTVGPENPTRTLNPGL